MKILFHTSKFGGGEMTDLSALASNPQVIGAVVVAVIVVIIAVLHFTGHLSRLTEKLGF